MSLKMDEKRRWPQEPQSGKIDLLGLTLAEMESYFASIGEPRFRARQVFQWIYRKKERDFSKMTNLSKALRERLSQEAIVSVLHVKRRQISKDGTQKVLFALHDGKEIEAVLIPEGSRITLCISSQVGCALGCRFCYTATMGAGRNLSVAEYMGQFLGASSLLDDDEKITNVVFMGMGEPLLNFENLVNTLRIMTDKQGLAISSKHLTISTAGIAPKIEELASIMPIRLALSLHATTNSQRDALMPINKRYNLETLFQSLEHFRKIQDNHRLPITLEYILIDEVNDTKKDAQRLLQWAQKIRGKINLISYNEHPGASYKRPDEHKLERFYQWLQHPRVRVMKRTTRGDDISAACGQLAIESGRSKNNQASESE